MSYNLNLIIANMFLKAHYKCLGGVVILIEVLSGHARSVSLPAHPGHAQYGQNGTETGLESHSGE